MKDDFRHYLAGALAVGNKRDHKDIVIPIPEPWRKRTGLIRRAADGVAALKWDVVVLGAFRFQGGMPSGITEITMENLDWANFFVLSETDREPGRVIPSDDWTYDKDTGLTYANKKDSSTSCILG